MMPLKLLTYKKFHKKNRLIMKDHSVLDIIQLAKENGIKLFVEKGNLGIKKRKTVDIPSELLELIKSNKKNIINFFENEVDTLKMKSATAIEKIDKTARPLHIPVSYSQERLWFIDQLEGSVHYHIPALLRVEGSLDVGLLKHSIRSIVSRHESLRTVFYEEGGVGYQSVQEVSGFTVSLIEDSVVDIDAYVAEEFSRPFDLSSDYLLRATIISLADASYMLTFVLHHIASDGWSTPLLVHELESFYNAGLKGISPDLAELPIQYSDYSIWQRDYLSGTLLEEKLAYWEERLSGVTPLNLPTDYGRPSIQRTSGSSYSFELDSDILEGLQDLSQLHGCTLFMTLLSIYKVLLYKYTGEGDICVGAPIANREQQEVSSLIGFFVNTIALRTQVDGQERFDSMLGRVKSETLLAYAHQDVPFEKVVERVVKERDQSRSPLFQTMLTLQNNDQVSGVQLGDSKATIEELTSITSKFDLAFDITEKEKKLKIRIIYSTALFNEDTIKRMSSHFDQLIKKIIVDPKKEIKEISFLLANEKETLLEVLNHTGISYSEEKTILDFFENQVSTNPDSTAVIYRNTRLTYKELDERSNQLAHYLTKKGVKEESLVGICIDRDLNMLTGILGILKAGGTYIPINPNYSSDRINYILEDTKMKTLLCNEENIGKFKEKETLEVVLLDRDLKTIMKEPSFKLSRSINSNDLTYIIYTSGSTGNPKGVMIEHGSLLDHVFGLVDSANLKMCKSFSFFAPLTADAGHAILFSSLFLGGTLHILSEDTLYNPTLINAYFKKNKIDCIKIVPSLWDSYSLNGVFPYPENVLIFGGDVLSNKTLKTLKNASHPIEVYNHYGPTETTIGKLMFKVDLNKEYESVPIGKPFSDTSVYILDEYKQLLPIGVVGELFIGGAGVARGYWNRNDLTREKFIDSPFDKDDRLYKTGDLVRWLADGNIEFIGRNDHQVKIRGYRIELGEIEYQLNMLEGIDQALVVAKDNGDGDKYLVSYTVGSLSDKAVLREELKGQLPDYMVPQVYVFMDQFPLTSNGKVDRKKLPTPEFNLQVAHAGSSTVVEEELVSIWSNVLGLEAEKISMTHNFFELGGHSLLAIRLVTSIQSLYEVSMNVKSIFDHPTIRKLATYITNLDQVEVTVIPKASRPLHIPVSYSQERLWFIDQLEGSVHYHIPALLRVEGSLDVGLLKHSIRSIVSRHESLRTVFYEEGGVGYQSVQEVSGFTVSLIEDSVVDIDAYVAEEFSRPFDLSSDYLLRATIISLADASYMLTFVLHHIASDGWSTPLLVHELESFYNAGLKGISPDLAELPIQYSDYSIWQRDYLSGTLLEEKLAYWEERLSGVTPLNLPTDYGRPSIQRTSGSSYSFELDSDILEGLQDLSQLHGCTLFMTLLSIYKVLLYKYTGEGDICVGAPIANREQQEVSSLIGFFVNTIALRTQVDGQERFDSMLGRVKSETLLAYAHQDVPFEKVVEAVVKERDQSRSPLFQTMLTLQNNDQVSGVQLGDSKAEIVDFDNKTSNFDLELYITEGLSGLSIRMEYCTALFNEDTIRRMSSHFKELVQAIVSSPSSLINDYKYLPIEESSILLEDFNNTEVDYNDKETVLDLFSRQVLLRPDSIAVKYGEEYLTYKEVDERSNQLAHYLRSEYEIGSDELVLLLMDRSALFLISVLGIWKSGGAYIPIVPDYPEDRIRHISSVSNAKAIIISEAYLSEDLSTYFTSSAIGIIRNEDQYKRSSSLALDLEISPSSLSYIIFTSGSTGNPKGAMIEHQGMLNHLYSKIDVMQLEASSVIVQNASQGFDISVWQFFAALLVGGTTVVYSQEDVLDPIGMVGKLTLDGVTILEVVPTYLSMLLDYEDAGHLLAESFSGLSYLMVTGETLLPTVANRWLERYRDIPLLNAYGPTEASDDITHYEMRSPVAGLVPIGTPIRNMKIYILDSEHQMCGIGVKGELCVSGVGVGRGYLNNKEKTTKSFMEDPFRPGVRMYKTGDMARYRSDGVLEFFGRNDYQVKIRGHRIELEEIEHQLAKYEEITHAIVVVKDEEQTPYLVGCYTAKEEIDTNTLSTFLSKSLPDYMIPRVYAQMEEFPLTSNGKIDRKRLNNLDFERESTYVPPSNDTEEGIVAIWAEILELDTTAISVTKDFFELGGNSLIAFRIITGIKERFSKTIALKNIFEYNTARKLSIVVDKLKEEKEMLIPKAVQKEYNPTSSAQERMFYHYLVDKTSLAHNISGALTVEGEIDMLRLKETSLKIIERHPSLRTNFKYNDKGLFQKVNAAAKLNIEISDASGMDVEDIYSNFQRPHDLENQQSLIRFGLYQVSKFKKIVLVDVHHIVCDGFSIGLIFQDFKKLLLNEKLPSLSLNYIDYSYWQRSGTIGLEKQKSYWKNKLSGNLPVIDLSLTQNRESIDVSKASSKRLILQDEKYHSIKEFIQEQEITNFMFFISIFYLLLYKITDNDDIIIGTDIIGRTNSKTKNVVGTFVNILPLRLEITPQDSYNSFLLQVKKCILEGYEHQDFQFDDMVKLIDSTYSLNNTPITQVHFAFNNYEKDTDGFEINNLKITPLELKGKQTTQYEFKLDAFDDGKSFNIDFIYSLALYEGDTMEIFAEYYANILTSIISNSEIQVENVQLDAVEDSIKK